MKSHLVVNEIFYSLQGESSYAGKPCVFVRLAHCDLRCSWCDTEYAFYEGEKMALEEIVDQVLSFDIDLVLITGAGRKVIPESFHPPNVWTLTRDPVVAPRERFTITTPASIRLRKLAISSESAE